MDTFIINKTGEKIAEAIENALKIDDKLAEQKTEVDKEVVRIEAIAKGRATGYVFDTEADMHEWLANSENVSKLVLGDNLYIRAVGVPDYWWDGKSVQLLEVQKVDLAEYAKSANTLSGYGITDAYTKEQSEDKFQEKLSDKQVENINDIPDKQNALPQEQLQNIEDIPKKSDKLYVDNAFTNALKKTKIEAPALIDDIAPIDHTLNVKIKSKNTKTVDLSTVTLKKYTANLLNYPSFSGATASDDGTISKQNTGTGNSWAYTPIIEVPKGTYTYSIIPVEITDGKTVFARIQASDVRENVTKDYTNGVNINITSSAGVESRTLTFESTMFLRLHLTVPASTNVKFKAQINLGKEALPFENYIEPITYTSNEEGVFSDVTSVHPTTSLLVDSDDVILECEYNRDMNKAFDEVKTSDDKSIFLKKNTYWIPVPVGAEYKPQVEVDATKFNINTTVDTMQNAWRELVTDSNGYLTLTECGKDASNTYDIFKVSAKPKEYPWAKFDTQKPKLLLVSGVHGSEKESIFALYYLLYDIVYNWKKDKVLEYLRWNVTLEILPLVSPWGFANLQYCQSEGVNINRNFDDLNHSIGYGEQENAGEYAFSAVETQYMKAFFDSNTDAVAYFDFHTTGGNILPEDQMYFSYHSFDPMYRTDNYNLYMINAARRHIDYLNIHYPIDYDLTVNTDKWYGLIEMGAYGHAYGYTSSIGIHGQAVECPCNLPGCYEESDFYSAKNLTASVRSFGQWLQMALETIYKMY